MAIESKERIIIPNEKGEEHLFEVLFTFDVDETNKSYVVVIPVGEEYDEEEEVEVFAFRYEETGDKEDDLELHAIETDEEWEMVEEMLNTFTPEDEDE
jgi:uncharacterized protein YrzB (UPF0473 family)